MTPPPVPKKARRSAVVLDDSVVWDDDESDSPFNLYFVRFSEVEKDAPEQQELTNLADLFRTAHKKGIVPKWIEEDKVFELDGKDDYFVVPCFRGKIFRRMIKEGYRIYGPPIVAECLDEEKPLPRWSHPVFSSVLEGVKLCFTMVPFEQRKSLTEKVSWMFGVIANGMFNELTHIVVQKADTSSEKYKIAIQNKIKMMRPDWIDELWEQTRMMLAKFDGTDKNVVLKYRLRTFEGLVMTVTRIDQLERAKLSDMVKEHGGLLSGQMARKTCTHLITDQMNGEKYKKATEWGTVNIVQIKWINKCVEHGFLIDESKYHPKYLSGENFKSSTPNKDTTINESIPDISSIAGHGGRLNASLNTSSFLTPTSSTMIQQRNRMYERPNASSLLASTIISPKEPTINVMPPPLLTQRMNSTPRVPLTRRSTAAELDPIESLRINMDEDLDFFENCMIFLCGVEPKNMEKWRQVLDRSGATRVTRIESATHVIVVSPSASDKALIRKYLSQPDIITVNAQWVIECFKKKDCVPYDDYEYVENAQDDSQSNSQQQQQLKRRPTEASITSYTSVSRYSEEPPVIMKGVFSQQTFFLHSSMDSETTNRIEKTIVENGGRTTNMVEKAEFVVFDHSAPMDVLITFDTMVTKLYIDTCVAKQRLLEISLYSLFVPLPTPPIPIFAHHVFSLWVINEHLKQYVSEIIIANGGTLVKEKAKKPENTLFVVLEAVEPRQIPEKERWRTVDLSFIVESVSRCRLQQHSQYLFNGHPMDGYERKDDVWDKVTRDRESTVVIGQGVAGHEESREEEQEEDDEDEEPVHFKNPHLDLNKPFKMKLTNLKGIDEVIDNMPSPMRDPDESMSTSKIGRILKIAVENTSKKDGPSSVDIRSNQPRSEANLRKTVSCTPTVGRKSDEIIDFGDESMNADSTLARENVEPETKKKRYPINRRFILSISELEQSVSMKLKEDILKLGGIIDNDYSWETTHLISARMNRTPKTLSAISGGKWCLRLDYVTDSVKAGEWLEEEDYEWVPSKLSSTAQQIEQKLVTCCSKWRKRIYEMPITYSIRMESRHNGAFTGWKTAFHEQDKRALTVMSILQAGDSAVFTIADYIELESNRPTIVLASKDFAWNMQSAAILKRAGTPILTFDYIYEYLVTDNIDKSRFYHSSFKKC